jgi:hypothetical protein
MAAAPLFPSFMFPNFPEMKLPGLKLPMFNMEAMVALQKANVAAAVEAQGILVGAVQAILKMQYGYVQEMVTGTESMLSGAATKKPEAMLADVQTTAGKAMAVAKEGIEVGVAAQRKVADLVVKRVQANMNELKALAA